MNFQDLANGVYRQVLAARTNIRTTSVGLVFALVFLGSRLWQQGTLTLADIEIATAIAGLGIAAKDGTKSGVPPKDVLGSDGI